MNLPHATRESLTVLRCMTGLGMRPTPLQSIGLCPARVLVYRAPKASGLFGQPSMDNCPRYLSSIPVLDNCRVKAALTL